MDIQAALAMGALVDRVALAGLGASAVAEALAAVGAHLETAMERLITIQVALVALVVAVVHLVYPV